MAGNKRPSFLKRQKEQARAARANEKREAKRIKKQMKADGTYSADADEFGDKSDYETDLGDATQGAEEDEEAEEAKATKS